MKLNINHKNLLDIINLHYKSYYPIKSFVSKEDFLSIVNNYKTKNNLFFPMPIYLNISEIPACLNFHAIDIIVKIKTLKDKYNN